MCWNKEVSLVTYITVIVLVVILIKRNVGADRHLAIFSAVFVTIQLLEFFAWLSIEKKDRKLNDLITRLILLALWLQPLANSFMAMRGAKTPTSKYLTVGMVMVFAVLFGMALVMAWKGSEFKTDTGKNCHLVWHRKSDKGGFMGEHPVYSVLYILGLLVPLLFIRPLKKGIALALIGLGLMIISRKMSSQEEFSSWWCWIAGVFTVAALIYKAPG